MGSLKIKGRNRQEGVFNEDQLSGIGLSGTTLSNAVSGMIDFSLQKKALYCIASGTSTFEVQLEASPDRPQEDNDVINGRRRGLHLRKEDGALMDFVAVGSSITTDGHVQTEDVGVAGRARLLALSGEVKFVLIGAPTIK